MNWALAYIEGSPLNNFTANEPAVSVGSMICSTILNAPFTWGFNRAENAGLATVAGTQDYTVTLSDFGFLEKVSLGAGSQIFEVKDVYNTVALGISSQQQRPNAVSVIANTAGTSIKLRFMGVPDAVYTATLTYQKLAVQMTATSSTWSGIPDQYSDIYNNLFLAEAFAISDDARAQIYRSRGVAALLAKSEGLTQMQINAFLAQWQARDAQALGAQLRTQQGNQARGL